MPAVPQGSNAEASVGGRSTAFRERARLEAGRYGPDPWIFVRELLQNSRDAGARTVSFVVRDGDGQERILCRDDGEGMSFEHARRYLFSLYASSKEDAKNQAGKFGVGFWSILRFEPSAITVRSRPRHGPGWGLRLDGALEHATHVDPPQAIGTEIVLERAGGDGRLDHRVYDAVWQSARYLCARDEPDRALIITVNDRPANAEFTLPAPSAAFRRGSVRGVVGLGPAPRVELFSRGLRVRSAASLEDLLAATGRHTARMRVRFPELPGGLAPQALLESDKLEVMLSRSDARDTRALAKLVRLGQQELERLIETQLSHTRPLPLTQRVWVTLRARLRDSMLLRAAMGTVAGLALALALGWNLWGRPAAHPPSIAAEGPARGRSHGTERARAYRDLGARYRGPKVDVLSPAAAEPIPLSYEPSDLRLYFAALRFMSLAVDGSPILRPVAEDLEPYPGYACEHPCIRVRLPVASEGPSTRIPVPTGYRIAANSTTLDGQPLPVHLSAEGDPAIVLRKGKAGTLEFRASPGQAPGTLPPLQMVAALPKDLQAFARRLRSEPVLHRVHTLLALVQDRVRYDRGPDVAERHATAQAAGSGFIERTLEIGAGDCDVQNGLFVALLHAAEVQARLAVGYVGRSGQVHPWLHAWVEYYDPQLQVWAVADASESSGQTQVASDPGNLLLRADPSEVPGLDAPVSGLPSLSSQGATNGPPATPNDAVARPQSFLGWVRHLDRRNPWFSRGLPLVFLVLGAWSWATGRTRRAIKLDHRADLSRLLQGVLQQPAAFGNFSALFTRPLVPLSTGQAISLNRARELAAAGRLYRTQTRPKLARKAARFGTAVVDARLPEGRTVADALGAIDLDHWAQALDASFASALTERINEYARSRGEDWCLRLTRDSSAQVVVLDLAPLGVQAPGIRGTRVVLVDHQCTWLLDATLLAQSAPQAAVFTVLDRVAERLDLPTSRRARLLSGGARRALVEGFAP